LRAEELEREGRLLGVHGVVAADREDRDVGLVEPADDLHVPEHARVAGEVELRAVLDCGDDANGLAHVLEIVVRARVMRVRERELDAGGLDGAAFVRVEDVLDALLALEPVGQLDRGDDGAAVLLRQLDGVAHVVAVTVCERDDVEPFGLELGLRALRVPVQEWVDVDALSARSVEAEARVTEPRQGRFGHAWAPWSGTPRDYSGRTVRCGREPLGGGFAAPAP